MFGQFVSIIITTLSNTNTVASRHIKRERGSLPVDVRRSKTSLLKLPTFGRAPIPLRQQVLAFLWFISNSEVIRTVSDRFDVTMSSLDRIIRRVSRACLDMRQEYIKWPNRTLRINELCQLCFKNNLSL